MPYRDSPANAAAVGMLLLLSSSGGADLTSVHLFYLQLEAWIFFNLDFMDFF